MKRTPALICNLRRTAFGFKGRPTFLAALAVIVVLLIGSIPSAQAVDRTWDGGDANNGNWTTGSDGKANWDGNANFNSGENVIFTGSVRTSVTINQASLTVGSITFTNAGAFTIGEAGGNRTLTISSGVTNNDDSLQTFSVNTITLGAAQTWNAGSIAGGSLTFSGTTLNLGASQTLTIDGVNNTRIANAITGTGTSGITKTGTGTLTLSGANTFTGAATINAGALVLTNGAALADTVAVNVAVSGAVLIVTNSETIGSLAGVAGSTVGIASGQTLTTGGNNNSTTNAGVISGAGSLTKAGTGTLELSGSSANNFSGVTTVSAGELDLNKSAGTDAIAGNLTINGGTLKLLANNQINDSSAITMSSGAFNLNGKTETVTSFSNSGGTFTTGTGTLIGTGNTVHWTGGVNTINNGGLVSDKHVDITGGVNTVEGGASGGVLQIQGSGVGLEMTGSSLTLNSDNSVAGKLLLQGDVTINSSSATSFITNGLALANPGFIDLDGGTRTFTVADGASAIDLLISAKIQNGALTKAGLGTMTLSGTNTFTNGATINAGALVLTNGSALADSVAVNVAVSGAALIVTNSETIGSLAGVAGSTVGIAGSQTLTTGTNNTDTTFAGVISGNGSLEKIGLGTMTLSGVNTYTNITTIRAGTLTAGGSGTLSSNSPHFVRGGTLMTGASATITNSIPELTLTNGTISGSGTLNVRDNVYLQNGTVNAPIKGPASLYKTTEGTVDINMASGLTGSADVTFGSLVANIDNALGEVSMVSVQTGGTLLLGPATLNNRVKDTAPFTLAGGKLDTAGHNETLGVLTLSASSTIDLGAGASVLHFAASASASWTASTTLEIDNWSGSDTGGGTDEVIFGSLATHLTSGQVAQIQFLNPAGHAPGTYAAAILITGEVVPVPEPATGYALGALALAGAFSERLRLRRLVEKLLSAVRRLEKQPTLLRVLVLAGFTLLLLISVFVLP